MASRIKGATRSLVAVLCAVAIAAGLFGAVPGRAHAVEGAGGLTAVGAKVELQAAKPKLESRTLWYHANVTYYLDIKNFPSNATLTGVSSSNPGVLKADIVSLSSGTIWAQAVKPGKSKVTATYTTGSGSKTVSATYTVKKPPKKVAKTIALNGKAVNMTQSKANPNPANFFFYKKTTAKAKATPASGWKLTGVTVYQMKPGASKWTSKKVKNGKAFKVAKGKDAQVTFSFKNSSGNVYTNTLFLYRGGPVELQPATVYLGQTGSASMARGYEGAKVTSVTSSSPGTLKVESHGADPYSQTLVPVKAGKSTVTMKYSYMGKSYSTSAVYSVKPYPNAFKSITVNGSAVTAPTPSNPVQYGEALGVTGTRPVVKVVPASGWKVDQMTAGVRSGDGSDWVNGSIENGKPFYLPESKRANVRIDLKNGSGEKVSYNLEVSHGGGLQLRAGTVYLGSSGYLQYDSYSSQVKVTAVTSSDQSVLKVAAHDAVDETYYSLVPVKKGESKVTVTYEANGKAYTTSATYTVKDYPDPFKSITVNGKAIDLSENKYGYNEFGYAKTSATVKVSLASGWSIQYASYGYGDGPNQAWTNGSEVSIPSGKNCYIDFAIANAAGDTMHYSLGFYRD